MTVERRCLVCGNITLFEVTENTREWVCATCGKINPSYAGMMAPSIASAEQVGGDHYRNMPIQPIDFIHKNNIPFMEGCVIKYVCRHRAKNGKQDIEKAIHFLRMLIEKEYS